MGTGSDIAALDAYRIAVLDQVARRLASSARARSNIPSEFWLSIPAAVFSWLRVTVCDPPMKSSYPRLTNAGSRARNSVPMQPFTRSQGSPDDIPYNRTARERKAFSVGWLVQLIRTNASTRRSFVWLQRLGSQVPSIELGHSSDLEASSRQALRHNSSAATS